VMAGGGHERDDIIFDQLIDKHILDALLQIQQLLSRNHLLTASIGCDWRWRRRILISSIFSA
jgi:hypothetical protein